MPLLDDLDLDLGLSLGSKPKRPKIPPEQLQQQAKSLTQKVMGGVVYAGETLDKQFGFRTARATLGDVFAGRLPQLSNLVHLIPGSDFMGWTSQSQVPSGEQLNRQLGISTGHWLGDLGLGMLTETIVAPPIISGPARAITALGKEAKTTTALGNTLKSVHPIAGASPTQMADEIMEGHRGLFGIQPPWAVRKVLGLPDEPMMVFGAGKPWAAETLDKLYRNPFSRAVRNTFDSRVKNTYDLEPQKAADELAKFSDANREAALVDMLDVTPAMAHINSLWDTELKHFMEENADAVKAISNGQMPESGDEFLRAWAEMKTGKDSADRMSHLVSEMREGFKLPDSTANALNHVDEYWERLLTLKDYWWNEHRKYGGRGSDLVDEFSQHVPRRLADQLKGLVSSETADVLSKQAWPTIHRSMRDIPGNSIAIQRISKDPRLTGPAAAQMPIEDRINILATEYGIPVSKPVMSKKIDPTTKQPIQKTRNTFETAKEVTDKGGTTHVLDEEGLPIYHKIEALAVTNPAEALARTMQGMPAEVLQTGLYRNDMIRDMTDYVTNLGHSVAGLRAVDGLLMATADSAALGPSVKQIMSGKTGLLRYSDEALESFKVRYAQKNGLDPATVDLDQLRVPEPFVKQAARLFELNAKPKNQTMIGKAIDKFFGWFRTGNYTVWPASTIRDGISGATVNWLHAFDNVDEMMRENGNAWGVVTGQGGAYLDEFKAFHLEKGTLISTVSDEASKLGTTARLWDEFAIGSGMFSGNPKTTAGRRLTEFRKSVKEKGIKGAWGSDDNPFDPSNVLGVNESLSQVTKQMAGTTGVGAPIKGTTFWPAATGEAAHNLVDTFNRYAMYSSLRNKNWSPAAAARQVKLTHYSHGDYTDAERVLFKRLFPFYSFTRKNLPAQLRELVDNPEGRTSMLLRGYRLSQEEADEKAGFVPSRYRKGFVASLGGGDFLTSYGLLPVEEAFNKFSFFEGKPHVTETMENFAGMSPTISIPAQIVAGKQFYTHRPLEDAYQEPTGVQWLDYAIGNSPAARAGSLAREVGDVFSGDLNPGQLAVNQTIGGTKIRHTDVERELAFEAKRIQKQIAESDPNIDVSELLFAREGADPEALRQLALYQALAKEAGKAAKKGKKKSNQ